jgi:hypothetical protein
MAQKDVEHAENSVGVLAILRGQGADTVKGAVQDAVSVYDEKVFHIVPFRTVIRRSCD